MKNEENIQPANTADPVAPANRIVNAAPPPGANQVGVFTTPQTLLTFSGATASVSFILQVLTNVGITAQNNKGWWMLGLSFAVGLIIYIGTVSSGTTWREKVLEIAVAVVNTFMIAAAVLGVDNFKAAPPANPTAPSNSIKPANNNPNTPVSYRKRLSNDREVSFISGKDYKSRLTIG